MFRHVQRGVTQEPLKGKGIAAAINQIFPGESVPEQVNAGFLYAPPLIISGDGLTQAVFGELSAALRTKEIVRRRSAAYSQIFPENGRHGATQGNDLRFLVLRVAVIHKAVV